MKNSRLLSAILIILLGACVYANAVNGTFLWDDDALVRDNALIKDRANLPGIFTRDIAAGTEKESLYYRPLQILTYMVDYAIWKEDVRGYHLSNILWHILAALALFGSVILFFDDRRLALLTGLFFVVHPVHTEAVTYISGRADPLALFFLLLTFIFYIKTAQTFRPGQFFFMLASYALALFSRENSLILPFLLLIYHVSFNKKFCAKAFLPLLGVALAYGILRGIVLNGSAVQTGTTTLFERLPGFFAAVATYIRLLFFPFGLHMEYGNKLFSWGDPNVIAGLAILTVVLVYAWYKKQNDRLVFFSVSWFLVALLPVSNLYPIGTYMAEHWLYVPSIGFFLIIAKLLNRLCEKHKTIAIAVTVCALGYFAILTVRQNAVWQNPIDFYERLVRLAPDSARAYNNLGKAYYNAERDSEEIIPLYKTAVELKPDYYGAYFNLGLIYSREGQYGQAVEAYKNVTRLKPNFARAHNDLGYAYYRIQQFAPAAESLKQAVTLQPGYAEAYLNLGNVYNAAGKKVEALAAYQTAAEADPLFEDAYFNLGVIYTEIGDLDKAIAAYRKTVEIDPNAADACYGLAAIYYRQQQFALAVQFYDMARKLGLDDPALDALLEPYRP